MDLTEGSETSAKLNLTPGENPKENTQDSEYGETLKTRISSGAWQSTSFLSHCFMTTVCHAYVAVAGLSLCSGRAGFCPWNSRGKANSWSPPPPFPLHKNLQKNTKLCNIVTATSSLN
jgi:hypothetical protein